jgi:hypothetical protein
VQTRPFEEPTRLPIGWTACAARLAELVPTNATSARLRCQRKLATSSCAAPAAARAPPPRDSTAHMPAFGGGLGRRTLAAHAVSARPPAVNNVDLRLVRCFTFLRARSALLEKICGVAEIGQHVQSNTDTLAGCVCSVATDQVDRAESIARDLLRSMCRDSPKLETCTPKYLEAPKEISPIGCPVPRNPQIRPQIFITI